MPLPKVLSPQDNLIMATSDYLKLVKMHTTSHKAIMPTAFTPGPTSDFAICSKYLSVNTFYMLSFVAHLLSVILITLSKKIMHTVLINTILNKPGFVGFVLDVVKLLTIHK